MRSGQWSIHLKIEYNDNSIHCLTLRRYLSAWNYYSHKRCSGKFVTSLCGESLKSKRTTVIIFWIIMWLTGRWPDHLEKYLFICYRRLYLVDAEVLGGTLMLCGHCWIEGNACLKRLPLKIHICASKQSVCRKIFTKIKMARHAFTIFFQFVVHSCHRRKKILHWKYACIILLKPKLHEIYSLTIIFWCSYIFGRLLIQALTGEEQRLHLREIPFYNFCYII